MKKVISKIINVVLVLVILSASSLIVVVGINKTKGKPTMVMGYGFMAVLTKSMRPDYPEESVVVIKKTDSSELKTDDIITFYSSDPKNYNMIITHRIVEATDNGDGTYSFTTKGDANLINDEYKVESERIIGKVITRSSFMEKLQNIRSNPGTFFLVIMLPLTAVIALELFDLSKRKAAIKEDNKNEENKDKK